MYRNCHEEPSITAALRLGRADMTEPVALCRECGEELFYGDRAYTWLNKQGIEELICADCLEELFSCLSLEEKAALTGSARVIVSKRRYLHRC